ncbi:MAG: hypothetical protein JKY96_00205 [Phycisphaerales bacterium]|nr:hypothetical protein [Phycisphaerales bacterium]
MDVVNKITGLFVLLLVSCISVGCCSVQDVSQDYANEIAEQEFHTQGEGYVWRINGNKRCFGDVKLKMRVTYGYSDKNRMNDGYMFKVPAGSSVDVFRVIELSYPPPLGGKSIFYLSRLVYSEADGPISIAINPMALVIESNEHGEEARTTR